LTVPVLISSNQNFFKLVLEVEPKLDKNETRTRIFENKIRPGANWDLTVNPVQVTQSQTGTRSDSQK
jgi:hypothetical protein